MNGYTGSRWTHCQRDANYRTSQARRGEQSIHINEEPGGGLYLSRRSSSMDRLDGQPTHGVLAAAAARGRAGDAAEA